MIRQLDFWACIPKNWNQGLKRNMCTSIFKEALFTIGKTWTQPINRGMDRQNVEYYSVLKKEGKEIL